MREVDPALYVWGRFRRPEEYDQLSRQIEHLNSLDLATVDDRTLTSGLDAVGSGYATRTIWSVPTTSFRASRPTNVDSPWSHIRELWAPPAKLAPRGRFNEAGKPVLYISSDPNTALMEVQPKPYEIRVLLVLKKTATKDVIHFVQAGMERVPEAPISRNMLGPIKDGLSQEPVLKDILCRQGIYEQWCRQDAYLSDLCARLQ